MRTGKDVDVKKGGSKVFVSQKTGKVIDKNYKVDVFATSEVMARKVEKQHEHTKKKELKRRALNANKANPLRSKRIIISTIITSLLLTSCGGLSIKTGEAIRQEGLMLNGAIQTAKDSPDMEGAYFRHQKVAEGNRFAVFTRRAK